MDSNQAKAYVNSRFKALTKEFPKFDNQYKVNLLLMELRQKHQFVCTMFSEQMSRHMRVKSVEFPTAAVPFMSYNLY